MDTKLFVRKQSGGMFAVIDKSMTTGNIFWVDSGSSTGADSAGYGQNPDAPFLTLDYAIGQCTANNGDMIFVMPGHTEAVAAASGIDLDVAGVKIVGLGQGDDRPKISFTTLTTATFTIDADDSWIENLIFENGIDSLATMIHVTNDDVTIKNCEFRDGASTSGLGAITVGAADGDSDRLKILDCMFYQPGTNNDHSIEILYDMTNIEIRGNNFYGDYDEGAIYIPAGGNACVNLQIADNQITNKQDGSAAYGVYVNGSSVTGKLWNNVIQTAHPLLDYFAALMSVKGNTPERSLVQHWYADSVNGSDLNDGRTPATAKATLQAAINEARYLPGTTTIDDTKDHNAIVHVAPGHYNEAIAFSGYNIKIQGEGPYRGKDYGASINYDGSTATNAAIAFSGSGIEICNLHIYIDAALPGIWCSGGDNNYIHDCHIECDGTNATYGIEMDSMKGSKIHDVVIQSPATAGIWVKGGADHYFINSSIERCQIYSDVTGCKGILVDNTNTVYNAKIHQNHIDLEGGGATSIGIDSNATGNLFITENYISVEAGATAAESAGHGMMHNYATVNGTVNTALDDD